ncbi:LysR family transcriptional regulator [Enterococcus faecalis]|uniref:LysR family transcriptional regulator n=1 Tax=Enterococcus faecalis TaxID=1351 RepID=UPI000DE8EABD|nr:LysR family transcriptional regulator [Enterococcus faecalis]RBR74887.1 LysR family transcriptional regulator [Enterococcus faecalis]
MTIEKLEYFYTIVKYNSISKAASELHVSKSTLSASLKDLESELGHLLFDRNGNSLTLNSYGDKIVQSVYIILNEAKKMKLNLHEMIENPVMRLGFGNTSLMYKVTENEDQLNRFWECYHGSSFELLNKLENHELDFVITSADVNSPVLKKEQLIELKMYLCVSREIKQEIEEEGFICLTNYPFLFLPHHLDHLEATKSVLEMLQLTSPLVCCYDTLMLTRLIEKSKGVYAVISLRKEQLQEIDSKLFFLPIERKQKFYLYRNVSSSVFVQPGQIKATLQKLLET